MNRKHRYPGRTRTLIAGDTLALLLFSALGRAEHKLDITLLGIIEAAAPFWLVWMVIGGLLRTFRPDAVESPAITLRRIVLPWLITLPLAIQLRAFILGGPVHISFSIITLITVFILFSGWRSLYSLWLSRRKLI